MRFIGVLFRAISNVDNFNSLRLRSLSRVFIFSLMPIHTILGFSAWGNSPILDRPTTNGCTLVAIWLSCALILHTSDLWTFPKNWSVKCIFCGLVYLISSKPFCWILDIRSFNAFLICCRIFSDINKRNVLVIDKWRSSDRLT